MPTSIQTCPTASVSRRTFIQTIGTVGFGALASSSVGSFGSLLAETSAGAKRGLIDTHHHFVPPFYLAENRDRIVAAGGGGMNAAYSTWTSAQMVETMDKQGVATAVLSLSTPGIWFGDRKAAAVTARHVNENAAELVRNHPGRFGMFAAVPLPDAEASLREIEYAFGVLKADGIVLMSSYDDKWLGDASYQPVFDELNRRKAVVFVHPTTALCCRTLQPGINPIMAEIPQDTTRAVISLLFSGTFSRCRDIGFIFSHAGGNVPMVVGRMRQYAPKNVAETVPNGIDFELKRLYYDIAGTAYRPAIAALTSLVPTTQILFGSDNPFVPLADTAEGLTRLGLSPSDLRRISRDNALRLLPGVQRH